MNNYYARMGNLLRSASDQELVEDTLKIEILSTDDEQWRQYCIKAVDVLENPEKYGQ